MKINPIDYLQNQHGIGDVPHITYDPDVVAEYSVIRGSEHDGTMLFTLENINACLSPLLNMETYCIPSAPENLEDAWAINYTIDDIEITQEFGPQSINGITIQGQHETVRIPVRCEYVMKP